MTMGDGDKAAGRALVLSVLAVPAVIGALVFVLAARSSRHSMPASMAAATISSNSASFTYTPGGQGVATSSRSFRKGAPGAVGLQVYGMPPQPGDSAAEVYADLSNGTARTLTFPGRATVVVTILRDGQAWRTLTLDQPATTSLDPGRQVRLATTVTLDTAGTYTLSAILTGS